MIVLAIFIIATEITNALTPSGTTAGHKFVVSFPYLFQATGSDTDSETHKVGTIYMATEEYAAIVDLYLPADGNADSGCKQPKYTKKTKYVKRYDVISFDIDKSYSLKHNGVYCALYIKASVPIRAWAIVFSDGLVGKINEFVDTSDLFSEAFKLIPLRSSNTIYHLSTKIGYPFVMVMSYDFNVTKINFEIPIHSRVHVQGMSQRCAEEQQCLRSGRDSIQLKQYEVWFFYLESNHPDLQGIQVTADKPIFVVSGNLRCYYDESPVVDICASALTPKATWGRKIFIPSLSKYLLDRPTPQIYIRLNAVKFPFHVDIYSFRTRKISTYWVKDVLSVLYLSSDSNHVMRSKMHFQLSAYIFFTATRNGSAHLQATSLNVIPVNQWVSGHSFQSSNRKGPFRFDVDEFLLIISSVEDGECVCKTRKKSENPFSTKKISWSQYEDPFPEKTNSKKERKFYQRFIENPDDTICFIDKQHGDSLMFNYLTLPTNTGSAFTFMPWDFYMAQLVGCELRLEAAHDMADDGIDNDCDGRVDEEYDNGKDDDGDGEVDEDYQSHYNMPGTWTEWNQVCEEGEKNGSVIRVRSCTKEITTRFGHYCEGNSISCDDAVCSTKELITYRKEIIACLCKRGCNDCQNGQDIQDVTREGIICMECKPNYYPDEYCIARCPDDRIGLSCIDHVVDYMAKNQEVASDAVIGILIIGIVGSILIAVILVLAYYEKKKRARQSKEVKVVRTSTWKKQEVIEQEQSSLYTDDGTDTLKMASELVSANNTDNNDSQDSSDTSIFDQF